MKRNLFTSVAAAIAVCAFTPAQADQGDITIGLGLSATQGPGIDVSYSLSDKFSLRGSYYGFNYDDSEVIDDIEYDLDLELQNAGLFLDIHPFAKDNTGLRLTGGLLYNGNNLSAGARPAASYEIGGRSYTPAEIGELSAELKFDKFAPYLGLGYDLDVTDSFLISADAGVIFQGSPSIDYAVTGPIANDASFQADIAEEEAKAQDDLEDFKYLPVVKLSLSYRF